jgi:two-component system, OmpR family, KDP operon response regulator KdpE
MLACGSHAAENEEVRMSSNALDQRENVQFGSIQIDRLAHEVSVAGTPVALTTREFELLDYLAERAGRLLTRAELVSQVWGPSYDGGSRTVDIHVSRLRRKLGQELPLVTLRRAGYRLGAPSVNVSTDGEVK